MTPGGIFRFGRENEASKSMASGVNIEALSQRGHHKAAQNDINFSVGLPTHIII